MKKVRMLGLSVISMIAALNAAQAQTDTTQPKGPDEVTAVSVKSGKLALSSTANPGPVFLPDGAYTNENNTVVVILDGKIMRVEYGSGSVTVVGSMRMQKEKVMLTPSVRALMSVTPFPLPSGTFTSKDGSASFTVFSGRPTEFTLPPQSP
jgi:hypothetical protein